MNIVEINDFIIAGGRIFNPTDYELLRKAVQVRAWRFIGEVKIEGDSMLFETNKEWYVMNHKEFKISKIGE